MTPLELAHRYMDCFYGTEPVEAMTEFLAENLIFEGPFYRFESRDAYLTSLEQDPPGEVSYRIVHEYQDGDSACLIYEFSKPGITTMMAQYFEVEGDLITKIGLVFDSGRFAPTK